MLVVRNINEYFVKYFRDLTFKNENQEFILQLGLHEYFRGEGGFQFLLVIKVTRGSRKKETKTVFILATIKIQSKISKEIII